MGKKMIVILALAFIFVLMGPHAAYAVDTLDWLMLGVKTVREFEKYRKIICMANYGAILAGTYKIINEISQYETNYEKVGLYSISAGIDSYKVAKSCIKALSTPPVTLLPPGPPTTPVPNLPPWVRPPPIT